MTDLSSAISDAVEAQLVTKWLVIAEVLDSDGNRYLHTLSSDDLAMWDAMGMMAYHTSVLGSQIEEDD